MGVSQFRILIVSAVKICKHYLQTASASEPPVALSGLPPEPQPNKGPDFSCQTPKLRYNPQMKIAGAAIECSLSLKRRQWTCGF